MPSSRQHVRRWLTTILVSAAIVAAAVALALWILAPDPVSRSRYDKIRIGMTQAELRTLLARSPDYENRELGRVDGPESYAVNFDVRPAVLRRLGHRDYLRQQWQSAEITITVISDSAGHVVCRYKGEGQPQNWVDHARLWISQWR